MIAKDDAGPEKSVGKIAHICAASPGGPRYDPDMTEKQRGAAGNLIVLRSDHHDLIDTAVVEHPTADLIEMKRLHEGRVGRAVRAATVTVDFTVLELVCTFVASLPLADTVELEMSMPTLAKINLNGLSGETAGKIETGLAQVGRVQAFVDFRSQSDANFPRRLIAQVKSWYLEAVVAELAPDDAFDYVLARAIDGSGPRDTEQIRAAALAVVALVFEICEIFEHE